MQYNESRRRLAWAGIWLGVVLGVVITVLILVGAVGPTLWFTVVAMACLALSQAFVLRSINRSDRA